MKENNLKYYTIKRSGLGKIIQSVEPHTHRISRTTLFHINEIAKEFENSGYIYILPEEFDRIFNLIMKTDKL